MPYTSTNVSHAFYAKLALDYFFIYINKRDVPMSMLVQKRHVLI